MRAIDHRPWPVPKRRWVWRQSWCDLLFAHWPIAAVQLRPLIPTELEIEENQGTAWVGVVPFRMSGVMRRPFPDMPGFSAFPEWNVRTYVRLNGRSGVWFFSLDATKRLAVWGGRHWFHLPYYYAAIAVTGHQGHYSHCGRRRSGSTHLDYSAQYHPVSPVFQAKLGSLEHWLTERYCLYAQKPGGQLTRTEVHHKPWPLQHAEAEIKAHALANDGGIDLQGSPPHCLFAKQVDVVAWNPSKVTPVTR